MIVEIVFTYILRIIFHIGFDVAALIFTDNGSNQQNISRRHCPFMCFRLDTRKIINYNKTWNFQPLSYMISMARGGYYLISHLIFLLC